MPLHVLKHPLASHVMTHLRDESTKPATFRTLSYQLGLLLAIESTHDLATTDKTVQTPLEKHTGQVLARPLVIVPILRAGLGMTQPFLDLFPDVSVGYVGLERDHETAVARSYYCKLPPLTSPEGVEAVQQEHPEVPIYTAAFDRELNDAKYIMPGLGDFGDRLYGT